MMKRAKKKRQGATDTSSSGRKMCEKETKSAHRTDQDTSGGNLWFTFYSSHCPRTWRRWVPLVKLFFSWFPLIFLPFYRTWVPVWENIFTFDSCVLWPLYLCSFTCRQVLFIRSQVWLYCVRMSHVSLRERISLIATARMRKSITPGTLCFSCDQ